MKHIAGFSDFRNLKRPGVSFELWVQLHEKCHLCDASDWENVSTTARWRSTLGSNRSKSPFHPGASIPLLAIPGMGQPEAILPDSCHCFHLGWGIDLGSSALVLLARCHLFGDGSFNTMLAEGYRLFTRWCHTNKKTTGINGWSLRKLDMTSCLACKGFPWFFFSVSHPTNTKQILVGES